MMESHRRSIAKTLSWRLVATVITAVVVWIVTESLQFAAVVGGVDTLLKLGAYYLHERLWNRVSLGRPREPDYQI